MHKVEKTSMFFGIGETYSPDWIWMVASRVIDISFVLDFMSNLKKGGASYWRRGNTPIPENIKYNTHG